MRRAVLAALALLLTTTTSAAADPVRFAAAFDPGARLGGSTSLSLDLGVPRDLPPATEIRILTPAGIDLSASGLGMATCARPADEVFAVMHFAVRVPCPANALMAVGRASAELRFDREEVYAASGDVRLFIGEEVAGRPGLVAIADVYRPVRTQFTYSGYLFVPSPEFGIGLEIDLKQPPRPPFGKPIALTTFHLLVGGPSLRYVHTVRGARTFYRPRAIPLPEACPKGGFRFRAIMRFADAGDKSSERREVTDTRVPCPPAAVKR